MCMATRVIPKTELGDRIREELARLGDDSVLITERGRPLAVVVSESGGMSFRRRWKIWKTRLPSSRIARKELGRPAESVFSAVEVDEADVSLKTREAGRARIVNAGRNLNRISRLKTGHSAGRF